MVKQNVIRGLHFQEEPHAQSKMISLSFANLDIARYQVHQLMESIFHILNSEKHESLLIPKDLHMDILH